MRTRAFLTTALAAMVLNACGATGDDGDTGDTGDTSKASEGTSQVAEPAPSAPTSTIPPTQTPPAGSGRDRAGTVRKTDPSGPYDLVPEDLRVRERADGDRVVLTFRGRGTAGWTARYVKRAVLDGSGRVVSLDGDTVLAVSVFGTPTKPSDRIRRVPTTVGGMVSDVYVGAAWEGVTSVFLGLEGGRAPYRISTLSSPSRLVVDLGDHG